MLDHHHDARLRRAPARDGARRPGEADATRNQAPVRHRGPGGATLARAVRPLLPRPPPTTQRLSSTALSAQGGAGAVLPSRTSREASFSPEVLIFIPGCYCGDSNSRSPTPALACIVISTFTTHLT